MVVLGGGGGSYERGTPVNSEFQRRFWKVDVWLPGKGNSNSHGTRPVHQIISMIKWIRTSKLSIKNFLSPTQVVRLLDKLSSENQNVMPILEERKLMVIPSTRPQIVFFTCLDLFHKSLVPGERLYESRT